MKEVIYKDNHKTYFIKRRQKLFGFGPEVLHTYCEWGSIFPEGNKPKTKWTAFDFLNKNILFKTDSYNHLTYVVQNIIKNEKANEEIKNKNTIDKIIYKEYNTWN